MKQIISFSGGKDSLSMWIKLKDKIKPDNLMVVFCDTQWEHPMTYEYISEIVKKMGAENHFYYLKNREQLGFKELVKKKSRFPSATARFCTTSLKVEPMIDFILDVVQDNSIIYQGIRHEESESRSKMNEFCTYFKYYFEPYDRNDWKLERLNKKKKLTLNQKKQKENLEKKVSEGKLEPKFFTYRKKEVLEYCKKYNTDVERPVIYLKVNEVLDIILNAGFKPNPLYYLGSGRVGCYPCIYVTKAELWEIIKNDFWKIEEIIQLEKDEKTTFFAPNYIPKRYHTGITTNKKGEQVTFCWMTDVVRYLKDLNNTGNLFAELEKDKNKSNGCMSAFNYCER